MTPHALHRVAPWFAAGAVLAPGAALPAPANARDCPPARVAGVSIIRLERALGCGGVRLAIARTVRDEGFYQDRRFHCRWGQGGTEPQRVNGRTFLGGYCVRRRDGKSTSFLARRVPAGRS